MPGLYKEIPSRNNPEPDPRCSEDYDTIGGDILATGGFGKKGARSRTSSTSASAPTRRT